MLAILAGGVDFVRWRISPDRERGDYCDTRISEVQKKGWGGRGKIRGWIEMGLD